MMTIPTHADPYTGNTVHEMNTRPSFVSPDAHAKREDVLRRVLNDGAAWETDSGTLLDTFCAAINKKTNSRLGANNAQ